MSTLDIFPSSSVPDRVPSSQRKLGSSLSLDLKSKATARSEWMTSWRRCRALPAFAGMRNRWLSVSVFTLLSATNAFAQDVLDPQRHRAHRRSAGHAAECGRAGPGRHRSRGRQRSGRRRHGWRGGSERQAADARAVRRHHRNRHRGSVGRSGDGGQRGQPGQRPADASRVRRDPGLQPGVGADSGGARGRASASPCWARAPAARSSPDRAA